MLWYYIFSYNYNFGTKKELTSDNFCNENSERDPKWFFFLTGTCTCNGPLWSFEIDVEALRPGDSVWCPIWAHRNVSGLSR